MKRPISYLTQFLLLSTIFICSWACQSDISSGASETDNYTDAPAGLPKDLKRTATKVEAAQFAWKTFIAINQPVSNENETQWENYKEAFDIFLPNAKVPTSWGEPTPTNTLPCQTNMEGKVLRETSKVSPVINETDQAVGGALIDRNGNLVHYEVYMNQPMFDYVKQNELYNAVTQAGSDIDFPTGSMELKAAWRILDPVVDDTTRYHLAKAIVYIPDSAQIRKQDCLPRSVEEKMQMCSQQLVGLVGLHVVYKTPSNPNFTWMTFEQVDNVNGHQVGDSSVLPSFRNKEKAVAQCPDNSRQCNCPEQEVSQITRQNPIPQWVQNVNQTIRDSLSAEGSIWTNYQLIGIQWAQDDTRTGNPILVNLANTSMETFNQTASSCVGCHAFARSTNPTIYSDFSWVMGRAQNPKVELPDATGKAILKYVMQENPYKNWESWPDTVWNTYSSATAGENPHGNSIRIYVNDIALNYYYKVRGNLPENPELPVGSIVMKENYRTMPSATPQPSDLVELTLMYKAQDSHGILNWFWMKSRPYGPVDIAGFDIGGCISCHMNWKGNGDGMLSFNFGKRPVITNVPYTTVEQGQAYSQKEIDILKKYLAELR